MNSALAQIIDRQAQTLRRDGTRESQAALGNLAIRVRAMYVPTQVWNGDPLDYTHFLAANGADGEALIGRMQAKLDETTRAVSKIRRG